MLQQLSVTTETPHFPRALIPHFHIYIQNKLKMLLQLHHLPHPFFFSVRVRWGILLGALRREKNMDPWKWNLTPTLFPCPHQSHLFSQDTPNPNFQSVIMECRSGAQLTMFYDGEVIVFDNIPAEKAKDIMSFATSQSQTNNGYASTFPANVVTTTSASSIRKFPFHVNMFPATPNNSDLPLARKASLHRFLEKRKDRIAARAPYQTSNPVDALNKAAESLAWLALAPKSPQDESESSSSSGLF